MDGFSPQNGEQLYQRSSCTVAKVLGPTTDFPSWGSGKRTENPQGNRLLEGTTKACVHQDPGERSSDPTRDWIRLACECPGVSSGCGSTVAWRFGALSTTVLEAMACWHKSFWRRSPLPYYPYHSLASDQTTGREHSLTHQQKFGLKIYWAWPFPPEQEPVLPTASPSHKEASTSLLSSSIRGQTEWKPESQKTNQTDYLDHKMSQWNYEPHYAGPPKTDGSWWRVLTKCGPLEKEVANYLSILASRSP